MMAELKLADDIQDPRLEEPVNDVLSKENISTSEPPLVLLTSSEERKRKRHGTKQKRNGPKIPKQSKAETPISRTDLGSLRRLRSVYFLGLLNDSRNCPICPWINANLPHWTGTLKESFIPPGKPGPFVALSNLLLHRNCCTSRMMAELKLADDIQDPRLEEPVNDIQSKENISTSEPPLVLLTSSEEQKRKRRGTKRKRTGPTIPKQSKAGHLSLCRIFCAELAESR
ncbi:unnamed protein product [Cyprideis torosa]|uniref:Uncharacterized protein n=1 Tax=Cyprideis torosa TaxID=163714 RepID=A0A7R8WEQ6_9CRUS|nr:unnamed protein product [Cyprideis torosa]CAG0890998.1 unnamed protein product [Cyprideis torosa]